MEIWFPAYRRHDQARIGTNDAIMALVASSRLAEKTLVEVQDESALVPLIFPGVPDLERMNRTVKDTRRLISEAEREFVYMAIPYLLSVHHVYVVSCLDLVRNQAEDDQTDVESTRLEVVHTQFTEVSGQQLPDDLVSLFHLLRLMRNRIVHYAAAQGSHLRAAWRDLPESAAGGWTKVAGRPLPLGRSAERLDLGLGELLASLMTVTRLGREVCAAVGRSISRERWADLVLADYRELYPHRFGQQATRLRRTFRYAQERYGPIALTEGDMGAALNRGDATKPGS